MKINKHFIFAIGLFFLVILSYWNVFFNDFAWDDEFFIVNNIHIREWKNIPEFFTEASVGNLYRPLRSVFYVFTAWIWELNAFGYHLNSLILHFIVSLLLYFIVYKITKQFFVSFVSSIFFAVHPVHTDRITNMTAAFDVLGILFFLIALFFYIKFSEVNKKIYFFMSIIFYTFALFSSEEAITFVLVLFLVDFSFYYKISLANFRKLWLRYMPYFFVVMFYVIVRTWVLGQIGREEVYFGNSFYGTMLTTIKIFAEYILILFFPFNLTIERVVKFETSLLSFGLFFTLIFLILLSIVFVKAYNRSRFLFFSIGWFFVTLLPFSNIFTQNTIMAERYLYLPSFGFSLFLALAIGFFYSKKGLKSVSVIFLAFIIILFVFLCVKRNFDWKDDFTLLSREVSKNPFGTRIHQALALQYRKAQDYENALIYAKKAIELSEKNYHAYENLGTINAYVGNYNDAIKNYEKAIELQPNFYLGLNNLGLVYSYLNDTNKSIFYLKKAIEANPKLAKAYNDLGIVYASNGNFLLSIQLFEKAIEINPYNIDYYLNLARAYEITGQREKSRTLLLKALEIEPNNKKVIEFLDFLREN